MPDFTTSITSITNVTDASTTFRANLAFLREIEVVDVHVTKWSANCSTEQWQHWINVHIKKKIRACFASGENIVAQWITDGLLANASYAVVVANSAAAVAANMCERMPQLSWQFADALPVIDHTSDPYSDVVVKTPVVIQVTGSVRLEHALDALLDTEFMAGADPISFDMSRLTDDVVARYDRWLERKKTDAVIAAGAGERIVLCESFDDGRIYRLNQMLDAQALRYESAIMKHCIHSYVDRLTDKKTMLCSVEVDGGIVATAELRLREDGLKLLQLRGVRNSAVEDPAVLPLLTKFGVDVQRDDISDALAEALVAIRAYLDNTRVAGPLGGFNVTPSIDCINIRLDLVIGIAGSDHSFHQLHSAHSAYVAAVARCRADIKRLRLTLGEK